VGLNLVSLWGPSGWRSYGLCAIVRQNAALLNRLHYCRCFRSVCTPLAFYLFIFLSVRFAAWTGMRLKNWWFSFGAVRDGFVVPPRQKPVWMCVPPPVPDLAGGVQRLCVPGICCVRGCDPFHERSKPSIPKKTSSSYIFRHSQFLFVKKSWFYYDFPSVKICPCSGEISGPPPPLARKFVPFSAVAAANVLQFPLVNVPMQ
jgi:hypothetical protein